MNTVWNTFVRQFAATFEQPDVADLRACVLSDLGHLGLVRYQGKDINSFLQGQLTNDVDALTESMSQLSGWCNPKGRVEVLFRLFRHGGEIFAQCPRPQVDYVVSRMRMFVLRADVKVSDVSDDWVSFGISGDVAATCLSHRVVSLPDHVGQVVPIDNGFLLRAFGGVPAFQYLGSIEDAKVLWRELAKDCTLDGGGQWTLLQIQAGMPGIDVDSQGEYLPQMLNFDHLGAVNFDKGCYVGQEIVARTQYLGRLKRRMFRVSVRTETEPKIGEAIYLSSGDETQSVGSIVMVTSTGPCEYEALAVLRLDTVGSHTLRLGNLFGSVIELRDLPYSLEVTSA